MSNAVSPDGNTLLVLTSGYNLLKGPDGNNITNAGGEYILFVYDISANKLTQKRVLSVPTAFGGIAWNLSGTEFYVGGAALDSSGLGPGMPSIVAGVAVNTAGTRLPAANYLNDSVDTHPCMLSAILAKGRVTIIGSIRAIRITLLDGFDFSRAVTILADPARPWGTPWKTRLTRLVDYELDLAYGCGAVSAGVLGGQRAARESAGFDPLRRDRGEGGPSL
jgi:hypothetical protein